MRRFAASGDLSHAPVEGGDEVADLARGYNTMLDAIEASEVHLVKAEEEQSALLRLIYPEAMAERVRSLGETYIGIYGLSSPRLDHAVRAVDWMRAATSHDVLLVKRIIGNLHQQRERGCSR